MSVLVVDASVVAALLFNEPDADRIAERLTDATLVAPSTIRLDLDQLCLDRICKNHTTAENYLTALTLFDDMALTLIEQDHVDVVRYAFEHGVAINHAHYLCLRSSLATELVTLDNSLNTIMANETLTSTSKTALGSNL